MLRPACVFRPIWQAIWQWRFTSPPPFLSSSPPPPPLPRIPLLFSASLFLHLLLPLPPSSFDHDHLRSTKDFPNNERFFKKGRPHHLFWFFVSEEKKKTPIFIPLSPPPELVWESISGVYALVGKWLMCDASLERDTRAALLLSEESILGLAVPPSEQMTRGASDSHNGHARQMGHPPSVSSTNPSALHSPLEEDISAATLAPAHPRDSDSPGAPSSQSSARRPESGNAHTRSHNHTTRS